ncbi:unnamed protein product [Ilex paraguariensis]|uniref:Uncharacterized protein n=1 Tax=Ilex paraguariensis TaxID=185542 RepID=A0ABC8TXX5_9AQUA
MTSTIETLQNKLEETKMTCEKALEERDQNQHRISKLETDLEALQNFCSELRLKLEDYEVKEDKFIKREAEVSQMKEDSLLSSSQMKSLFDKISGIEVPFPEFELEILEPNDPAHVNKLFYIIDSVTGLQHRMTLLSRDKENLQSSIEKQVVEIEHLKDEVEERSRDKEDSDKMKNELFELVLGLENIIKKLGGGEFVGDQKPAGVIGLLPVLEKLVMAILQESENVKSKAQELGSKLLGSQKVVDELLSKVKLLEDSNQGRIASPEAVQEGGILEVPSLSTRSEISEIEDVGPVGKRAISPAPSAAHVRTLRKGSSDQLAINIDPESDRLLNSQETDEDKGHVFKSLNTSGLIPRQGKMAADRIDGIWVSGGRALMSRPRARLGLIVYWLFLHIWLLGTVL